MGFFSKKKEEACPEGSIHAWEYNGVLYRTKEARDAAEMKERRRVEKENFIKNALKCIDTIPHHHCGLLERDNLIRSEHTYRVCLGAIWDAGIRGIR